MSLKPEALYFQLGRLVAEMPDLASDTATLEKEQWLARAAELVGEAGGLAESIQLRVAIDNLDGMLRERNAQTIAAIVHRALRSAEREAPPSARGAFIVADSAVEALAAVRKVLATAETDVMLVDPKADAKVLTDVAALAPDDVTLRLLGEQPGQKALLEAAAERWERQFGRARVLLVRLAAAGTLRDTLVLVDGTTVWALRHSFGTLAKRTHTSVVRIPAPATARMVRAYAAIWDAAMPLSRGTAGPAGRTRSE